jgi:hypothetical protein
VDLVGLALLGGSLALLFVPVLSLSTVTFRMTVHVQSFRYTPERGDKQPAALAAGGALLLLFVWYEVRVAQFPILPRSFTRGAVAAACLTSFLNAASFFLFAEQEKLYAPLPSRLTQVLRLHAVLGKWVGVGVGERAHPRRRVAASRTNPETRESPEGTLPLLHC